MGKYYEARFVSDDGSVWCAVGVGGTPKEAREHALGQLACRQTRGFDSYQPTRLLIYECTLIEEYIPPEPATSWRRVTAGE